MWILWDTYSNNAAGEPVMSFNMAVFFFFIIIFYFFHYYFWLVKRTVAIKLNRIIENQIIDLLYFHFQH